MMAMAATVAVMAMAAHTITQDTAIQIMVSIHSVFGMCSLFLELVLKVFVLKIVNMYINSGTCVSNSAHCLLYMHK